MRHRQKPHLKSLHSTCTRLKNAKRPKQCEAPSARRQGELVFAVALEKHTTRKARVQDPGFATSRQANYIAPCIAAQSTAAALATVFAP